MRRPLEQTEAEAVSAAWAPRTMAADLWEQPGRATVATTGRGIRAEPLLGVYRERVFGGLLHGNLAQSWMLPGESRAPGWCQRELERGVLKRASPKTGRSHMAME